MVDPISLIASEPRLTAELVARVERMEPDPGPEEGTSEHTDAE